MHVDAIIRDGFAELKLRVVYLSIVSLHIGAGINIMRKFFSNTKIIIGCKGFLIAKRVVL